MRKLTFLLALLAASAPASAESTRSIIADEISPSSGNTGIGIGTSSPDSAAILDLESTSLGFLPPHMTTTQKNAISSPVSGLIVYDTTLNALQVYNGSGWVSAGGGGISYAADTGSANAYAIAPSPAATSYAAGNAYVFFAANANTGASTLNVSSLGTKSILNPARRALVAGDIQANHLVAVVYDGTDFQMISEEAQAGLQVSASPLTTKGDTLTFTTVPVRHAVPGDYGQKIPDSGQTDGWRNASYTQIQQGRPGKNYIQYADFENDATTGWALGTTGTLTNGLPTGTPSFSSGADSNLSIAAASSLLGGSYDLSLSEASGHDLVAGNALWSNSYAIDPEDEAKVLTVKFYYTMSSGASQANFSGTSSNTYAWAPYDVTNSVWLSSAGNFCMIQSSGHGYCTGTFQTGSSTANIRFALYVANATSVNSSATTLHVDDFYVGPQTSPMGPAMTDWVAYTPTWAADSGTPPAIGNGTIFGYYRRIGDTLYAQIRVVAGSSTTGGSSGNAYTFTLPTGLSIDTTKVVGVAESPSLGTIQALKFGTSWFGAGVVSYASTTTVRAHMPSTSSAGESGNLYATTPFTMAATGNEIDLEFFVPIVGWSSNTSMSSDTDTRVIGATVSGNATGTIASTYASGTALTFPTVSYDKSGSWSGSTYTVAVSGLYDVAGTVQCATTYALNGYCGISLYQNGASVLTSTAVAGGAQTTLNPVISGTISANAGDTLTIRVASTGSSPSLSGGVTANYISITRRSGPAVVAATESVNAHYHGATASLSGSSSLVKFTTSDFDSHSAYSPSTGNYLCPSSGKYQVNAALDGGGTWALNGTFGIQIYYAGALYTGYFTVAGGAETTMSVSVSDTVNCASGSAISIEAFSSASSPVINSTNNNNFLSITRVGN